VLDLPSWKANDFITKLIRPMPICTACPLQFTVMDLVLHPLLSMVDKHCELQWAGCTHGHGSDQLGDDGNNAEIPWV
jgi:hypothetical protein